MIHKEVEIGRNTATEAEIKNWKKDDLNKNRNKNKIH